MLPDLSGAGWMAVSVAIVVSVLTLSVSAYTDDCRGADDPLRGITASGRHTEAGVCACGPGLAFGTLFWVEPLGWMECADRGGLITDGHLDVWMPTESQAYRWGRREMQVVVVQ